MLTPDSGLQTRFVNRREAGRLLATKLKHLASEPDVVVLALPRGGVPVAHEIARALHAPLDVFVVRKLGVPVFEEYAMGAIASGGVRILNEDVVRRLGITPQMIEAQTAEETTELERREREYRGDKPPLNVRGRTVVLVDDGLATGATMRAAVRALRAQQPKRIVVAVPVGARETCEQFEDEADEVVCGIAPENLNAVGMWYRDFSQTTDEEVRQLLAETEEHAGQAAGSRHEGEQRIL